MKYHAKLTDQLCPQHLKAYQNLQADGGIRLSGHGSQTTMMCYTGGIMELTDGHSKLSVNLSGGKIIKLALGTVPILGTFTRIDGTEASSHMCVPNFDTEGMETYNLPKHGPFRNTLWQVVQQLEHMCSIRAHVPVAGTYPSALEATQTFTLEGTVFTHHVTVTNKGKQDAPVNIAFHYYWHTPEGWEKIQMNGKPIADLVKKDTYTNLAPETAIDIPGHRTITLKHDKCPYVQLWTGRKESQGSIIYDQSYVCIEPFRGKIGYFGTPESIVHPGESVTAQITLSVPL